MAIVAIFFAFIFSVMFAIFAEANPQDIFIATAGYSAVLVTFLGNLQNSTG